MKFAALGRTHLLFESIKLCLREGHQAVLIGTAEASPEYTVTASDFQHLASEVGCPFFLASGLLSAHQRRLLKESGAEIVISINWPTLLPTAVLNLPRYGVLNAHAGDLPRFRGNACPNWAILAGERQIVLTVHRMIRELDAGPILLQKAIPLSTETRIGDVYAALSEIVPQAFLDALNGIADGSVREHPQSEHLADSLRCFPRLPVDGEIDWKQPAEYIHRLVRASSEPFAGAYTYLGEERVIVWKAHVEQLPYPFLGVPGQIIERRAQTGAALVLTGDGVLALEEIESPPGSGRISPTTLLISTRLRLGLDVASVISDLRARIVTLEHAITRLSN